jgi:hypothetical protein
MARAKSDGLYVLAFACHETADGSACASLFKRSRVPFWRTREVQHRHRETLLGQAPFEELHLKLVQLGFEEALVSVNVPKVGLQTHNSFAHNMNSHKPRFKCHPL